MLPLMKTAPVSDMNRRPGSVIEMLKDGPVALMARSDPAAVLVSPNDWNEATEQLNRVEELEDLVEALEDMLRVERGELELEEVNINELEEWADRVPA